MSLIHELDGNVALLINDMEDVYLRIGGRNQIDAIVMLRQDDEWLPYCTALLNSTNDRCRVTFYESALQAKGEYAVTFPIKAGPWPIFYELRQLSSLFWRTVTSEELICYSHLLTDSDLRFIVPAADGAVTFTLETPVSDDVVYDSGKLYLNNSVLCEVPSIIKAVAKNSCNVKTRRTKFTDERTVTTCYIPIKEELLSLI